MKREIEIKVKIDSFDAVKNKFAELGCTWTEPVIQDDTTFVNYDGDYMKWKPNTNFLRIRKMKGKTLFTLKQSTTVNELVSLEKEFEVSDAQELQDSLELMGYHAAVRVVKTRMKTHYKNYEICLDNVEKLGAFIEVEHITDMDPDQAQTEMTEFLKNIGVDTSKRVMNGYDTLMYMKLQSDK